MKQLMIFLLLFVGISQMAFSEETENQEVTLSIIKPGAVDENHIGGIISHFEGNGLKVAAMKMVKLTKDQAGDFYEVHKGKPFFDALTTSMSSGPIVVMVLKGPNAIAKNRELMGATDPSKAAPGTIRARFAKDMTANAVHGSDSDTSATAEIAFFFQPNEIVR